VGEPHRLQETGLAYRTHWVRISRGEQFKSDYLSISPNNKIPAVVAHDGPGGRTITLFESGAILLYLADKTGRFLPEEPHHRWETVQWLMWQMGGFGPMLGQAHHFNAGSLYKRFTPAGPDHAQVAASAGMADYIDAAYAHHVGGEAGPAARGAAVHDLMRAPETALLQPLLDAGKSRNSVRLVGPAVAEGRAPTVALALNRPGEEVAAELAKHGIMAGGGDFYAVRALEAMGVDMDRGVLRLSFTHYTSQAEMDQLLNALDDVL